MESSLLINSETSFLITEIQHATALAVRTVIFLIRCLEFSNLQILFFIHGHRFDSRVSSRKRLNADAESISSRQRQRQHQLPSDPKKPRLSWILVVVLEKFGHYSGATIEIK